MKRRISETLVLDEGRIACRNCGYDLAAGGTAWKPSAAMRATRLAELVGMGAGVSQTAVLREFACPGCGALLDTEVALPGDPYLDDIVNP